MRSFTNRFSEQKVAQWAIGYLAISWIALQVLQLLWEVFEWPLTPLRITIAVAALGFPITVILAWVRQPTLTEQPAGPTLAPDSEKHPARVLILIGIVFGLLGGVGWTVKRALDQQWARGEAVLELGRLADAGAFATALEVGERALEILPDLVVLNNLLESVSQTPSIRTEPSGARVLVKDYNDIDGLWLELGTTPLSAIRVPRGLKRWRIVHDGFEVLEQAAPAGINLDVSLQPEGSIPEGMVWIPAGEAGSFVTGIGPLTPLEHADYFIDQYEVSNEAYAEFVAAGGYEREEFWKEDFMDGNRRLTWPEAMERFEDATGQPGPATWELGRPKPGDELLPVTGVSWYEASAYAQFKGQALPTLRHWVRAAGTGQGGLIIPLSNFEGNGPATPMTFHGISPSGAFDMAGNVREWIVNSAGDQRHAVGGAWSDPSYFFSGPNVQAPFDRLPTNGFRLAQYTQEGDFDGQAGVDTPLLTRDYYSEQPVSDEVFRVYASQFDYDPSPLNSAVHETIEYEFGEIERVSFEGVGWGRIFAFLYLPKEAESPYQTVIWFPGSGAARLQPDPDPTSMRNIQHFVASGRAVLQPIFRGTYSRADADQPPGMNTTWPKSTRDYVDLVRSWVSEFRRSIDYLESRSEINDDMLAYFGTSWGGRLGAIIPAVESRLKLNMVMIGGLASGTALPEVDQINYVTRITVPTLMLNGEHDPLEPIESAQLPMLSLLGTSDADKHHIIYPGFGHGLPQNEVVRETIDWLDKYFGAPN